MPSLLILAQQIPSASSGPPSGPPLLPYVSGGWNLWASKWYPQKVKPFPIVVSLSSKTVRYSFNSPSFNLSQFFLAITLEFKSNIIALYHLQI